MMKAIQKINYFIEEEYFSALRHIRYEEDFVCGVLRVNTRFITIKFNFNTLTIEGVIQ